MSGSKCFTMDIDGTDAVFLVTSKDTVSLGDSEEPAVPSETREFRIPESVKRKGKKYSVTAVSDWAFRDCADLTHLEVPACVKKIGDCAFYGCASLETVELPKVKKLRDHVFCGCSSLKGIAIPASVKEIDPSAFDGCVSLESFDVDPKNKNYSSIGGVLFADDGKILVRYPVGRRDEVYSVPEGTECLQEESFAGTLYLKTLYIPKSVEEIENHALYTCLSVESVGVDPENENYSSDDGVLFTKDLALLLRYPPQKRDAEYTVPDRTECVGYWAFGGCTGLRGVTLSERTRYVCDFAFAGCSSFAEVTVPESVCSLGWGAYNGCDSIKDIDLRGERTAVHDDTFDHGFTDADGKDMKVIGGHRYSFDRDRMSFVQSD